MKKSLIFLNVIYLLTPLSLLLCWTKPLDNETDKEKEGEVDNDRFNSTDLVKDKKQNQCYENYYIEIGENRKE